MRGKKQEDANIELGLAISAASLQYGQTRSAGELAAFCNCSRSNIQRIERKALQKMRKALVMRKDPVLQELLDHLKK